MFFMQNDSIVTFYIFSTVLLMCFIIKFNLQWPIISLALILLNVEKLA